MSMLDRRQLLDYEGSRLARYEGIHILFFLFYLERCVKQVNGTKEWKMQMERTGFNGLGGNLRGAKEN
jgi:hypothetical protein